MVTGELLLQITPEVIQYPMATAPETPMPYEYLIIRGYWQPSDKTVLFAKSSQYSLRNH